MKIEIWSDIVCPFCYIGKRRLEQALNQFAHKDAVEIVWRSFQLDPNLKQVPGQPVHEYLAKRKGISPAEAKEMYAYMAGAAKEVGLQYDFDNAKINNTMDGHRLSHLALKYGRQNEVEEKLFAAYYTEGKDIGNLDTLVEIGESAGLNGEEIRQTLQSEALKAEVRADQQEAEELGVRGVPFFVFNNKYAVSGAQPAAMFLQALQQTWQETEDQKPVNLAGANGASACDLDGNC